jgi:hypothetical protein
LGSKKKRCIMASPIAATPVLEGEDAEAFWKLDDDDCVRVPLTPVPKIQEIREKMLEDDRNRKK